MTSQQRQDAWTKAVNTKVSVGPCANNVERAFWRGAVEAKDWTRLLWYKWDRIAQEQSGISVFDHSGE